MRSVRIRRNLLQLDKIELQALNDGFEALLAVEGPGGYQQTAGVYGQPGRPYRPTTPQLFLPWHRAYLMAFEQALDRLMPAVTLAYWDWSDESTIRRGIPGRLGSVAYSDKDHGVWLNALSRAPIDCIGHQYYTVRSPGQPADLEPLVQKVREASSCVEFEDFANRLEQISRAFRAWVGGHFNDDDFASYDPIFWFHHANLDRLWAGWQKAHPLASMPDSLVETMMEPFSVTVRDVLDTSRLAYVYDEAAAARA
jgi:tyrosinase